MEVRVRALDRVLRAKQIWVPNWYSGKYLVAYWDVFGRPETQPPYARGDADLVVRPGEVRPAEGRGRAALSMGAYILRRLLLIVPTLFGILLVNFLLVQFMPGGPIEQIIAELESQTSATDRITGGGADAGGGSSEYRGAQGLPPEFIEDLERQFGFDKPAWQRFLIMLGNYLTFDFGESYFRSISVVDLVLEKMPVSITLGLWSTLLAYLISIPLGIRKAVRDGTPLRHRDRAASSSSPTRSRRFLFAVMLLVLFAGGSYWRHLPAARPHLRQLGGADALAARCSTTSGTSPCR